MQRQLQRDAGRGSTGKGMGEGCAACSDQYPAAQCVCVLVGVLLLSTNPTHTHSGIHTGS